jgi:hypothetical protein
MVHLPRKAKSHAGNYVAARPSKSTGQVVRDLARVLVGQTTEAVIDVNEESKPVLEAFLSDVHWKYSMRNKTRPRVLLLPPRKLKRRRRSGPRLALRI